MGTCSVVDVRGRGLCSSFGGDTVGLACFAQVLVDVGPLFSLLEGSVFYCVFCALLETVGSRVGGSEVYDR